MRSAEHRLVVCTENSDYEASLELRKLYEAIPDADAEKHGQLRVIDESGEDYLYSKSFFIAVKLPQPVVERIFHVA